MGRQVLRGGDGRAAGVRLQRQDLRGRRRRAGTRPARLAGQRGRPVHEHGDARSGRCQGSRRDLRGVRRTLSGGGVPGVARERPGAPESPGGSARRAVRASRLQPARRRHRLPDRVRLHRHDLAGAAARRPGPVPAPGPGGELRRRRLRRHVLHRHVCGRLLRERSPARGRAGAARHPGRQQLRAADRRPAGLAPGASRRLARRRGARSSASGTGTCARGDRPSPAADSTSRPASTVPTWPWACCMAAATTTARSRSPPARGRTPTATWPTPAASWAPWWATRGCRTGSGNRCGPISIASTATPTTRSSAPPRSACVWPWPTSWPTAAASRDRTS